MSDVESWKTDELHRITVIIIIFEIEVVLSVGLCIYEQIRNGTDNKQACYKLYYLEVWDIMTVVNDVAPQQNQDARLNAAYNKDLSITITHFMIL